VRGLGGCHGGGGLGLRGGGAGGVKGNLGGKGGTLVLRRITVTNSGGGGGGGFMRTILRWYIVVLSVSGECTSTGTKVGLSDTTIGISLSLRAFPRSDTHAPWSAASTPSVIALYLSGTYTVYSVPETAALQHSGSTRISVCGANCLESQQGNSWNLKARTCMDSMGPLRVTVRR